jgi:protein TonB
MAHQAGDAKAADVAIASVSDTAEAWRHVRTVIVPPDIVAVPRRSQARPRKRTPLRIQPEGTATGRAGDREWFSDRLFVERQDGHETAGYGTAVTIHLALAVGVIAFVLTRPDRLVAPSISRSLAMPILVSPVALADMPEPRPVEPLKPKAILDTPAPTPAPAPAARSEAHAAVAPIEAPSSVTPETGAERQANASTVDGGLPGGSPTGVVGGVVGGVPGGVTGGTAGGSPPVPVRVGPNMTSPRKIKDLKPVYPAGTLQGRTQGAVILDVTIGTDGRVQDAKVIRSVPLLDAAAIEAVRQWEYTPSLLNGVAVAVVMTVIVNFAMQ